MNVDTLIKWGMDKFHLMNETGQIHCLDCSSEYLDEKIGWFNGFRDVLCRWKDIVTIVKEAETFFKFQGFYRGCQHDLKKLQPYNAQTRQGNRFKGETAYVKPSV